MSHCPACADHAGRLLVATVTLALAAATPAHAQVPASSVVDGIVIEGPPPPVAPDVINRDTAGRATVRAVSAETPIRVDGSLDEAFYRETPSISDFVQALPVEGAPATERTETWVAFDDDNVYVAARLFESAPESDWVANEMRRDSPSLDLNDQFAVYLDTYYDRRNGVGFVVNPLGGFSDLQIQNEEDVNSDWNPIVEIRTGRFDGGWTVEMAIPFRSLRYRPGSGQVWGIQMRRSIVRKNEWNHLTALPLAVVANGTRGAQRVSMYATLVGVEPPPPRRQLDVKPYGISGIETDHTADPRVTGDGFADAGLDVKYGITRNLTADFTVNTDFAQVEVDEQQVNLTRFSLFFPEKREFFLEGRGIFEFGNGGRGLGSNSGGGGPPGSANISRSGRTRGGRSVNAPTMFYSRRIGLQAGEPVPITGGARVTGKVGSFDVGAVGIRTGEEAGVEADATTFTALRLRRDVLARSNVGVLFAGRSRSLIAETGSNEVFGADANLAFGEALQIFGYYARSQTEGLDGNDQSYRARFSYRGDVWGATADHVFVGDDFNPEVGFLRRKGLRESNAFARYSYRPAAVAWMRRATLAGTVGYVESASQGFVETRVRSGRLEFEMENGDWFTFNVTDSFEHLPEDTGISGATIPAGDYDFSDIDVSYYFGPHRRVSGSVSFAKGDFYSGDVTSFGMSRGRIEVLPQLSLEPSIELNWIDLPDLQEREGEFNQHVARSRITYSLTPRTFVSALVQYNTGTDSFGTNVRLRWEWAPGSELFVVYTEDRDTDVLDRWSDLSGRSLVIKATRLLRL